MFESPEDRAVRVKGYSAKSLKNDGARFCKTGDGFAVEPVVVNTISEYIDLITDIETSVNNPVFYHGHANANYLMLPTVMRDSLSIENKLFDEFRRRFPNELKDCNRTIEKLCLMQHYGLYTRCIDLTENPLIGLYFAVSDMVKFRETVDKNTAEWGEVVLIRLRDEDKDDLKYFDSSTVSVISNIAKLEEKFSLQQVQLNFLKDYQQTSVNNFVYFRDIICRSVIVRTKQDFPRIINQRGAFILVNSNEVTDIFDEGIYGKNNSVKPKDFMEYMIEPDDYVNQNLYYLQKGLVTRFPTQFKNTQEWDFRFKKINPYSLNNSIRKFQYDPFDLRRILYKHKGTEKQLVVLIPPKAKPIIKGQLAKLGITEEYVYPEMDSVSYALNNILLEEYKRELPGNE